MSSNVSGVQIEVEASVSEATDEAMEVIKDCRDEKAIAGSSKFLLIFVEFC
jgi:hypothetical protein